ncbi:hypothetical protein [Kineococcus terrestris]|uniref:hypothetical protein n=1 Tax=Kineococcus terrestris TaxID=2044856 RepID=UPI0034DB183F
MGSPSSDAERADRRVRPWALGLLAVIIVGYGGFTLTENRGWAVIFSLLLVVAGLTVLAVTTRELLKQRKRHHR